MLTSELAAQATQNHPSRRFRMTIKPFTHHRKTQEGATLLVTVVTVTVLIAVLLAVSTQLTLGSRIGASERRDTLQAQYAAESGLALARYQINDIQQFFVGKMNPSGDYQPYINFPKTITPSNMNSLALQFCNRTSWVQTSAAAVNPVVSNCTATAPATTDNLNRYDVLANYVDLASLPDSFYEVINTGTPTIDNLRTFWRNAFLNGISQQVVRDSDTYTVTYRLVPLRVVKTGDSKYRFYLQVAGVTSTGTKGNTIARVVNATATANSEFWFEIGLPSFLEYVLFTNYQTSSSGGIVNFTNQSFDGPVHTNQYFTFANGATAQFLNRVGSAGCYQYDTANNTCAQNADGTYKLKPGVRVGNSLSQLNTVTATALSGLTNLVPSGVRFANKPKWNDMYLPMPANATDQASAAAGTLPNQTDRGLSVNNGYTVELAASTSPSSVVSPTTYNSTTKTWTPTPQYQFVTIKNTSGSVVATYRMGTDKILTRLSGSYGPASVNPFNGVIYSSGSLNVGGPPSVSGTRTSTDYARFAPPALADFAQLNVTAQSGISIYRDLTYTSAPCKPVTSCNKPVANNMLGLYAQTGDVTISTAAPSELSIHGAMMSSQGEVTVQNYNSRSPSGSVHMIGSLIENSYGAFGTFNPSNPTVLSSGYGRDFSYDDRMGQDYSMAPPYFPVSPTWVLDNSTSEHKYLTNLTWQQGKK